jgi:hypothetical protein|tara:strand:- start:40 stop:507 length:468 start_codon:yes stop_codon:yes gene_type:complete
MSNHRTINIKINNPFSPESKLKRITRKTNKTLSRAGRRTDKLDARANKQARRADYKLYKASKAFDRVAKKMDSYYGENPDRFPFKKELERNSGLTGKMKQYNEAKQGGSSSFQNKPNAKFPDLSGDGKITKKDILMGRGVIKKPKMLRNKRKDYV